MGGVSPALRLRRATAQDRDVIYSWANDPQTRASSFDTAFIEYGTHCAWFEASLGRATRRLYVAEVAGAPAALLRLDWEEGLVERAVVGINIAPEQRGQGLGPQVLRLLEAAAGAEGVEVLVAYIRAENHASVRAFVRAGYALAGEERVHGWPAWRYERRVGAA